MSSTSSNASNLHSSARSLRVILERNGKRVEVNARQVVTENLRKMFQVRFACNSNLACILLQVNPSAWLGDDCDGSVYFPDQDSHFNLEANSIAPYSTLVVEGPTTSGLNMSMGYSSTVRATGGLLLQQSQQSLFAAGPSSSSWPWTTVFPFRDCPKEAFSNPD